MFQYFLNFYKNVPPIGAALSWEKGKFKPKGDKKAALVALRKLSKRDLKKMLAEKIGGRVKAKPAQGKGKKLKGKRRSKK
jgi:hypothetical protein